MDSRREKYKDKVLSHIIGKTKLISTEDESTILIEPPFVALQVPYLISHKTSYPTWTPFPRWAFIGGFKKYCELFGLSKSELTDLFQSYNDALLDIIKNKYYDKGSINESMDKQRQFLDKVLDRILSETEITLGEEKSVFSRNNKIWGKIKYPFLNTWGNNKGSGEYSSDIIEYRYEHRYDYPVRSKGVRDDFLHHCEVIYGLTHKESVKLLKKFRTILKDKIESELFTIYGKDYMSTYRELK